MTVMDSQASPPATSPRSESFFGLLRSLPRQTQLALGGRGVAWAGAALGLGLICCGLAIVTIIGSLDNAEVEQRRHRASEVRVLDGANRLLMRNILAASMARDPEERQSSVLGSWATFRSSLTAVCGQIDAAGPEAARLGETCSTWPALAARLTPEVEAFGREGKPLGASAMRDLLAVRDTVTALSVEIGQDADGMVRRLANDYRSAMLILIFGTAGFVGAGVILVLLIGRASMQHYEQSRKAEEAVALLRETVEALPAGVVVYDGAERLVMFNSVAATVTPALRQPGAIGRTYEDMARDTARQLEAEGHGPQPVKEWITRFRSKTHQRTRQAMDGRWFDWSERGTTSGLTVGLRVDVTEVERARAEYALLVDSLSDVVFRIDIKKGTFTFVSAAVSELLGVPASELIGKPILDLFAPEDRERARAMARNVVHSSSQTVRVLQCRMKRADGTYRHVELRHRNASADPAQPMLAGVISDVEERVQLARQLDDKMAELERARVRYQLLVDSLTDLVYATDAKGIFTYASPGAAALLKVPSSVLIGTRFRDWVVPDDVDKVMEAGRAFHRAPNTEMQALRFRMKAADGTVKPVELRYRKPVGEGQDAAQVGVIRDMGELERVRLAYQALVDSMSDVAYRLNVRTGRFTFVSAAAAEFFGTPPEQLIGRHFLEIIAPEDRERVQRTTTRTYDPNDKGTFARFRMIAKGGEIRTVEVRASRRLDDNGDVISTGVIRDVEEKARLEQQLEQQMAELERARAEYRSLVDSLGDIVYKIDVETGRITFANAAAAQFFGLPLEQIVGTSFPDRIDPESRKMVVEGVRREFKNSGRSQLVRFRMRAAGDAMRHVEVRYRRGVDEHGKLIVSGVMRDVEERVQLERRLERETARLRSVVESSGALIVLADRDLQVVMVNSGFTAMTGIAAGGAIGRPLHDVLECPVGRDIDQSVQFAIKLSGGDHSRLLAVTATPVIGPSGEMSSVVLLGVDDTGRREAEMALHDVERYATVGEMAAMMAHEISQPLQVINIACASASEELAYPVDEEKGPDKAFVAQKLERIGQQVDAASRIVGDLRAFVRGANTPENVGLFDPVRSIESAIGLTAYGVRQAGIELRVRPIGELPKVAGESGRLEQVLVNLINNARDAGGRVIEIVAEPVERDGRRYTRIVVDDSGHGIDPEVLPRLFVSFVTTKSKGKGTGLGLRICRRIVEEMGGSISAANRTEGGARFEILLPAAAQ